MRARMLLATSLVALVACGGDDRLSSGAGAGTTTAASTGAGAGAGAGGSGGSGGGGTSVIPDGPCLDLRTDTLVGPGDDEPRIGVWPNTSRHPFWRSDLGIHLVWDGQDPAHGEFMALATFDATSGDPIEVRRFDDGAYTGIMMTALGGAPDGRFAVSHTINDAAQPIGFRELVTFGRVDDPAITTIDSPWPREDALIVDIAFDGEAFVVHGLATSGGDFLLSRYAFDGATVSPIAGPASAGYTGAPFEDSTDWKTDPVSGHSWTIAASSPGVRVSAHDREGQLLPGLEADGYQYILPQGKEDPQPTSYPTVGFDGESVMLAWSEIDWTMLAGDAPVLQLLNPQVSPGADALAPRTSYSHQKALLRGFGRWLLLTNNKTDALDLLEFDADGLAYRAPVVTYGNTSGLAFDARNVTTVDRENEVWLGFHDLSAAQNDITSYRVVRVTPTCSYMSMYDSVAQ